MKQAPPAIYQLRIALKEIKPQIWRRIEVPSNITLPSLHRVIQLVMGWKDYHLHRFTIAGIDYGEPDPDFYELRIVDERWQKLDKVMDWRKVLDYEYDFGDSWVHEVRIEKKLPLEERAHSPICVDGKRACPPEDCGGIWGYKDFLKAIRNPNHPEHEEWLTWVGGHFNPEAFDLEKVNRKLAQAWPHFPRYARLLAN